MAVNTFLNKEGLTHYDTLIKKKIDDGDAMSSTVTVELGAGGVLGGYKTGDVINESTPIETVIKKLLAKQVPPTYTAPTIKIANNGGDASGSYEYGTKVTPKLKATFTQNDAGSLTAISIKKGTSKVADGTTSPLTYTGEEITLTDTVSFTATASYSEGAIKNDNLGDPYSEGHIAAGSKTSSSFSYTVYRPGYFWGVLATSSDEEAITSDIIREGTKKEGAYAKADTIGSATSPMTVSSVADRKRIFVACPSDKTGITKVIMPSAMNADCTSYFVKQDNTINVAGANGTTGVDYNVWIYEPALISDDQTFIVTLG